LAYACLRYFNAAGYDIKGRINGLEQNPAKLYSSASLAKELLGWQAKYSDMETLIKTSWDVYKEL
jgi:UDP-glucose 4-epimerase